MLKELRGAVWEANMLLSRSGLAPGTWGNASGIDRERGIVAIKASGVPYERMTAGMIVLVDLEGRVVSGDLKPSSDTPTHIALYRAFPHIGGVAHTHSQAATAFAQACRPIPCLGTTHADHFDGDVPVTRFLNSEETAGDYEAATGKVIVETFTAAQVDPMRVPAVLVAGHGPFTWGKDARDAVENAIALEAVAAMALGTLSLSGGSVNRIPDYLLRKHFDRKHGPGAYYGQR